MSSKDIVLAAAGGTAEDSLYIEDVFSTYLYTGNSSTQTITNGIDLSGDGGMVWIKDRSGNTDHQLFDTNRGANKYIASNKSSAQDYLIPVTDTLTSFNASGFSLGADGSIGFVNANNSPYASWTFRKAPKFFDVVTYTGDGVAGRTISHNLGVAPGMMFVKCSSNAASWIVYHISQGATKAAELQKTGAFFSDSNIWNNTSPTASVFSLGTDPAVNVSGRTYVAYLFAHDTSTDGLIQCGSFTTDSSASATVNLGWEPQYLMIKRSDGNEDWQLLDVMRGDATQNYTGQQMLYANTSGAEFGTGGYGYPTSTGFRVVSGNVINATYIYMAIRRGPMRTPTDATKVFSPLAVNAATGTQQTTSFPVDMQWAAVRAGNADNTTTSTRLIGVDTNGSMSSNYLVTSSTAAEATGASASRTNTWWNTGFKVPSSYNSTSTSFWSFQRAPGFFDVVCYTGTGIATTVTHNLGVAPELIIVKKRGVGGAGWAVYSNALTAVNTVFLNTTAASAPYSTMWSDVEPTSTVFTVGTNGASNQSSDTYVAYLFASCPGVSKVGSYTGTGATQTISCGFTGGARFVLIKRTDSTGDWYVWDTARGMVSGTDPFLRLNLTNGESNVDSVYTTTGGFQIVSTDAPINASGGSYIYLAIA